MRLMVLTFLMLAVQVAAQPTLIQVVKDETAGVTGLAGPAYAVTSNDERFLYVASRFEDAIALLEIDPVTGMLAPLHTYRNGTDGISGLFGVVDLEMSSDGMFLYAAAYDGDSVHVFSCNQSTGALTRVQAITDGDTGVSYLEGARDVELNASGSLLYVVASGNNAVNVFTRNPTTGLLTLERALFRDISTSTLSNLIFPANIAVAANDRDIYVACRNGDNIHHMIRNADGTYTVQGIYASSATLLGLDQPDDIAISPDQKFLYLAGDGSNVLSVYAINSNGSLAPVELYTDGAGGNDNLAGITSVTFSADAGMVFAAARKDAALTIFSRNATSGKLTRLSSFVDDTGLLTSLDGLNHAVSALDGRVVYLMGRDADAISVLSYNPPSDAPIAFPNFLNSSLARLDNSGILHLNLPDPNSDGAAETVGKSYLVTLQSRGHIAAGPYLVDAAEAGSWPYDLSIDVSAYPLGSYGIGLRRAESLAHASGEIVLPSPVAVASVPAASPANFTRWLSHVPRRTGGFGAELQLVNRSQELSAEVALVAFNAAGAHLATETRTLAAAAIAAYPLYNGAQSLFANFGDQVSHIAIWEANAGRTRATLLFSALTSGFQSVLAESNLQDGETVGSSFYVPAKGNASTGEGFAVLNLTGSTAASVVLEQVNRATGAVIAQVDLGEVAAGSKRTFVLSSLLSYVANTAYRISAQGDSRVELVWLALEGDSFIAPLPVTRQR